MRNGLYSGALVMGLFLAGCGGTATVDDSETALSPTDDVETSPGSTDAAELTEPPGSEVEQSLIFGIPSPLATEPGEHNINLGVTCYAEANDGEVITLDANLDVNKQITDFDSLLAQGADVLPFLALDPNAFEGPFERAADNGAVVVELYNPDSAAPGSVYEDSRAAGEDAVQIGGREVPRRSHGLGHWRAPDSCGDRAHRGVRGQRRRKWHRDSGTG